MWRVCVYYVSFHCWFSFRIVGYRSCLHTYIQLFNVCVWLGYIVWSLSISYRIKSDSLSVQRNAAYIRANGGRMWAHIVREYNISTISIWWECVCLLVPLKKVDNQIGKKGVWTVVISIILCNVWGCVLLCYVLCTWHGFSTLHILRIVNNHILGSNTFKDAFYIQQSNSNDDTNHEFSVRPFVSL